jgi:hypothetical protein
MIFFVEFLKDKFCEDPSLNDVYGGKLSNLFLIIYMQKNAIKILIQPGAV